MRLVKILTIISIPFIAFYSISHVKADNTIVDFSNFGSSFAERIYDDFNDVLKSKGYEFIIYDDSSYLTSRQVKMIFYDTEYFSQMRLDLVSSSNNIEYKLYKKSSVTGLSGTCSFSSNVYNDDSSSNGKKKCMDLIESAKVATYPYVGYASNNIGSFNSSSSVNKKYPFYISNENIDFVLPENFSLIYGDENFSDNITVKDLFYANHFDLFSENQSVSSVDLTNVEKMLYFICFFIFIFFIVFVFKLTFKFIHAILPI